MSSWTDVVPSGGAFANTYGHRANVIGQQIIVTGGSGVLQDPIVISAPDQISKTVRHFDRTENVLVGYTPDNLTQACFHATSTLSTRQLVMFGGKYSDSHVQIYNSEIKQVEQIKLDGATTDNRFGHTMSYIKDIQAFIIFGGIVQKTQSSELYQLNNEPWILRRLQWNCENWPAPRAHHTASVIGKRIYFFGGLTANGASNQLLCLDLHSKTWIDIECKGVLPKERYCHGAIVLGKIIFIVGGLGSYGDPIPDCAIFDTVSRTWLKTGDQLNLPKGAGYISTTLSGNQIYAISPTGSWAINPQKILGYLSSKMRGEEELSVPAHAIEKLQRKLNEVVALLERTTEKHTQISELLDMESCCLELQQMVDHLAKLPRKFTTRPVSPMKRGGSASGSGSGSNLMNVSHRGTSHSVSPGLLSPRGPVPTSSQSPTPKNSMEQAGRKLPPTPVTQTATAPVVDSPPVQRQGLNTRSKTLNNQQTSPTPTANAENKVARSLSPTPSNNNQNKNGPQSKTVPPPVPSAANRGVQKPSNNNNNNNNARKPASTISTMSPTKNTTASSGSHSNNQHMNQISLTASQPLPREPSPPLMNRKPLVSSSPIAPFSTKSMGGHVTDPTRPNSTSNTVTSKKTLPPEPRKATVQRSNSLTSNQLKTGAPNHNNDTNKPNPNSNEPRSTAAPTRAVPPVPASTNVVVDGPTRKPIPSPIAPSPPSSSGGTSPRAHLPNRLISPLVMSPRESIFPVSASTSDQKSAKPSSPVVPKITKKPFKKLPASGKASVGSIPTQVSASTSNAPSQLTRKRSSCNDMERLAKSMMHIHTTTDNDTGNSANLVMIPPSTLHNSGNTAIIASQEDGTHEGLVNLLESNSNGEASTVNGTRRGSETIDTGIVKAKKGFVWKRKKRKKGISQWKLRYFRLKENIICYYATDTDLRPLGEIDVVSTKVRQIRPQDNDVHIKDNKLWCMEFTTTSCVYHIATETEHQLQDWMEVFRQASSQAFVTGIAEPVKTFSLDSPASSTTGINQLTHIPISTIKGVISLARPKKEKYNIEFIGSPSRSPTTPNIHSDPNSSNPNSSGNPLSNPNPSDSTGGDGSLSPTSSASTTSSGMARILKEIVDTEEDYVNDLLIIKNFYIQKLEDFNIMKKDIKDAIFANVEELVPLHQEFLKRLKEEAQKDEPDYSIPFEWIATRFGCYTNYCTSQADSAKVIASYKLENPNFEMCLVELKGYPECKQLDLESYLIKPLQRICKYPLLLRELLKSMPEEDAQFHKMQAILDRVSEILSKVNEQKRTADNIMQLFDIQDSIIDKDLKLQAKGRYLIKEGEFKKVLLDNSKEPLRCKLWLFNDVLLVAKRKDKEKFFFKAMMPTDKIIVWDLDPNKNGPAEKRNGFSVVRTDIKNEKLVVLASSAEEKTRWIEMLNDCIAQGGFVDFGPLAHE